ncbi:MAG: hypothetical protein ACTHYR_07655 [Brachybacterium sp.]
MTMPPYGYDGGTPSDSAPAGPGTSSESSAARATSAPLATAALIVCIAAFVLGLVPLLGAGLGLVGIVLVIVAARRGLATKRTYAGALAAAVGALASIAASIALVGLVLTPNDPGTSEPTVAQGETEEVDQDAETETETAPSDPAEEDPAPEADPVPEDEPLAEEEPVTTQEATPEPTEEPSPSPTEAPDLSIYEELDERTLARIVKAPDDHLGRQVIVYGAITQLDAATGKCFVRISIADAPQDAWYDYEHNSVGFAGDGESDCPVLDPFVADDEVKLWITIGGSISYDTQIGGSTTVPAYLIDEAELL